MKQETINPVQENQKKQKTHGVGSAVWAVTEFDMLPGGSLLKANNSAFPELTA